MLINKSYSKMTCQVMYQETASQISKFEAKTGVRQGCLLSPSLFLPAVDWAMKETPEGARNGIQWTYFYQAKISYRTLPYVYRMFKKYWVYLLL